MSGESGFARAGLIILLAGAIVALGAHELYHRNPKRLRSGGLSGEELVRQLHGEHGIQHGGIADRARLRQQAAEEKKAAKSSEDEGKSELKKIFDTLAP